MTNIENSYETPKEELVITRCWKPDCRNIAVGRDGSGWEWCAEHEDQENTGSVLHTFQERYDYDYYLNKVKILLQTEQTRIAEEVEKTSIEWEDSKDELYTYFGKCSCGETSVIVGSKYCYGCGKIITNPLRSSESLSIIKQGK